MVFCLSDCLECSFDVFFHKTPVFCCWPACLFIFLLISCCSGHKDLYFVGGEKKTKNKILKRKMNKKVKSTLK